MAGHKNGGACGFMVSIAVLFSSSAYAYIPPSHFIVKNVASKHAGFKTVRVRSTIYGMDGNQSTNVRFKQVTWIDYPSRLLKSRAYDEAGHELYAVERKLGPAATLIDEVLFDSQSEPLARVLRTGGVPTKSEEDAASDVLSLGRYKGRVAWVIGGPKPKESQLWIEKDSFVPIRIIGEKDGADVDARFENPGFFHEFPYPRTVLVAEDKGSGDNFILRDEMGDVSVSFDVFELKNPITPGFTDAGNSADSGVRNLIQKYFRIVR